MLKEQEKLIHKIAVAVEFFNTSTAQPIITETHGIPLLTLDTTPHNVLCLTIKRLIDIVVSGLGVILLSPFFLYLLLS